MFNLEQFQEDFEAGKFSEFHYYSSLVKELGHAEIEIYASKEIETINLERFINLSGDVEKKKCMLMIDTQTGYLYSPSWFNSNNNVFNDIDTSTSFFK